MPNWSKLKKMAAAFGRAVEDPSATKGGRDMVFKSKTVQDAKDRTGDYTVRINEKDTPAQKSFKAGRYQGQEASEMTRDAGEMDMAKRIYDNYDYDYARAYGPDAAYDKAVERARVDEYEYLPTSRADFEDRFGFDIEDEFPKQEGPSLQEQWDKEAASYTDRDLEQDFDKAFNSNINRRKEKVRGGFGGESADMFEEQLWNIIDELKANGKSGNEILDMLRVDKPKAPYGE